MNIEIPNSFNASQKRAAEAFISQVVEKAQMASKPDVELKVDFDEQHKMLNVWADSEMHTAFGTIALGPRGKSIYADIRCGLNL